MRSDKGLWKDLIILKVSIDISIFDQSSSDFYRWFFKIIDRVADGQQ